jgi:hypothetical protein
MGRSSGPLWPWLMIPVSRCPRSRKRAPVHLRASFRRVNYHQGAFNESAPLFTGLPDTAYRGRRCFAPVP